MDMIHFYVYLQHGAVLRLWRQWLHLMYRNDVYADMHVRTGALDRCLVWITFNYFRGKLS